ncbi:hypothetical protein AAG606_14745 [Citromicrobium bathyomarinum]
MADAIQRAQQNLAKTQTSLSTGKKAQDYAGLGTEAVRTMSARSMLAKQEAQAVVSKHVTTSLAIYDAHVTGLDNTLIDLRTRMATAIGTEDSSGLQETIKGAFEQFRSSLTGTHDAMVQKSPAPRGQEGPRRPYEMLGKSETGGLDGHRKGACT